MKFDQLTLVLLSKLLLIIPFAVLLVIDIMPPVTTHIEIFTVTLLIGLVFFVGVVPLVTIGYVYYLDTIINAIPTTPTEQNI